MTDPVVNLTHDLVTTREGTQYGWRVVPGSFRCVKANDFASRVSMGPPTHSEMDAWLVLESADWSHGIGPERLGDDPAKYQAQDGGIEAAIPGKLKLAPQWRVSDNGFAATAFADYGNFCLAGSSNGAQTKIRYYAPAANTWADATAAPAGVVAFEKFGGALYVALGDGSDMMKCTNAADPANPASWATVTGHRARALKKWKKLLWTGYQTGLWTFDGTNWSASAIAVGDPSTNVLWLATTDTRLVVAKEEGLYVTDDGVYFDPILTDIPEYAGNFAAMRPAHGWLYYNLLSAVNRMSGLGTTPTQQAITPTNVRSDTYGWGIPVGIAASTKYVWVLFNLAENDHPVLLKYNQQGWHPAFIGASGVTAHSVYYSRVAGRLFVGLDTGTLAQRYTTINDEGYPDYDTTRGHTIDLLRLEASLAEIVKAWREVVVETRNCSAGSKIELYYKTDDAPDFSLADTATASPKVTLSLDAVNGALTGKDITLRLKLYTDSNTETPEVRGVYLRYMPRPDTIYALEMTLELGDHLTLLDGSGDDPHTLAEQLTELRALTDAKQPFTVDSMDGLRHKAFVTSIAWTDTEKVVEQSIQRLFAVAVSMIDASEPMSQ